MNIENFDSKLDQDSPVIGHKITRITTDKNTNHAVKDRTYFPNPDLKESSLSMRIMHKPSRSQTELERASDPTKQNSLQNAISKQIEEDSHLNSPDSLLPWDMNGHSPSSESLNPSRHKLVRKKSGEIVKPLLKDKGTSKCVRPQSLPTTPTYKQVHFGGDTDVRYFKQKDRPTAILALNSPKHFDDDDDEDEEIPSLESEFESCFPRKPLFDPEKRSYFDYYDDELNSHVDKDTDSSYPTRQLSKSTSIYNWQLCLLNFPVHYNPLQNIQNGEKVFLETLDLSQDKRYLVGKVAVYNLAFEKSVIVRYSVNGWSTIVEIQAFFTKEGTEVLNANNYDRFVFKIPLDLFINGIRSSIDPLSTSTTDFCPELCVKYLVDGQVLWDNNKGKNYLFTLTKGSKLKPALNELPETARTKQEAHEKKPKYSSSYLKRINSNTSKPREHENTGQLLNGTAKENSLTMTSGNHLKNPPASSDDFECNNYYLSSPLFSSLTKKASDLGLQDEKLQNPSAELDTSFSLDRSESPETPKEPQKPTRHFLPDTESPSFSRMSENLNEPMSYRDFLDSYCFFNANFKDNCSKAILVMSDSPSMEENEATSNGPRADLAHSVSTFLT